MTAHNIHPLYNMEKSDASYRVKTQWGTMCNLSKDIHGVGHWLPCFQNLDSYNRRVTNVLLITPPQEYTHIPQHPFSNEKQRKSHSGSGEYALSDQRKIGILWLMLSNSDRLSSTLPRVYHLFSMYSSFSSRHRDWHKHRSPSLPSQKCICLYHLSGFSRSDQCPFNKLLPFHYSSFFNRLKYSKSTPCQACINLNRSTKFIGIWKKMFLWTNPLL